MKVFFLLLSLLTFNAFAESPEENFVLSTQQELGLSEEAALNMRSELQDPDPYSKGRKFFCFEMGAAVIGDIAVFSCRNFKREKIEIAFAGLGASISLQSGVGILYAKKNSRSIKTGTYSGEFKALNLGLGVSGLKIRNENLSIDWQFRGVTVGAGLNFSLGMISVTKIK